MHKCQEDKMKENEKIQYKENFSNNNTEGRIVGGYKVERDCMKRPWIVLIK